jgi:hypothetical protein
MYIYVYIFIKKPLYFRDVVPYLNILNKRVIQSFRRSLGTTDILLHCPENGVLMKMQKKCNDSENNALWTRLWTHCGHDYSPLYYGNKTSNCCYKRRNVKMRKKLLSYDFALRTKLKTQIQYV